MDAVGRESPEIGELCLDLQHCTRESLMRRTATHHALYKLPVHAELCVHQDVEKDAARVEGAHLLDLLRLRRLHELFWRDRDCACGERTVWFKQGRSARR